jgi:hypothetical protein
MGVGWNVHLFMSVSSFRREVDENCALLDYYAARIGNSLPAFPGNLSVPSSRLKKDGTDRLSRSVG